MTIKQFADHISRYESDTFSSSGSMVDREHAQRMAEYILGQFVENHLDGVILTDAFSMTAWHKNDKDEMTSCGIPWRKTPVLLTGNPDGVTCPECRDEIE